MKEKIKKLGLAWIVLYAIYLLVFIVISFTVYRSVLLSKESFNITTYATPIFGMASLFLAMVTIRYNAVNNKEKNALDFVKDFKEKEIHESLVEIYKIKKKHHQFNSTKLDRKKISPYCEKTARLTKEDVDKILKKDKLLELESKISFLTEEQKYLEKKETKEKIKKEISDLRSKISKSNEFKEIYNFRSALVKTLNIMERCANGVRYGIYDEGLIYNSYGTQFIEIYELAFTFIKTRQQEEEKLYINAEWLAVKWTLQKEIEEDRPTFMMDQKRAIQHANEELKRHLKAPNDKKLKPLLKKMNKLRFPV